VISGVFFLSKDETFSLSLWGKKERENASKQQQRTRTLSNQNQTNQTNDNGHAIEE